MESLDKQKYSSLDGIFLHRCNDKRKIKVYKMQTSCSLFVYICGYNLCQSPQQISRINKQEKNSSNTREKSMHAKTMKFEMKKS